MLRYMILLTYLIIITSLSLLPSSSLPIPESGLFPHADKVIHFGMYTILTFLLFFTWPDKFYGKYKKFLPLLVVFFWGTIMEVIQGAGGYGRHFSTLDILANTLGFFPGWLAWKWFFRKRYQDNLHAAHTD